MKIYKVVATIEFPDGREEFVLWEPELYGEMVYRGVDIEGLFYNTLGSNSNTAPVSVLIELYENPVVEKIRSKMGEDEVMLDLLIGTKIFPIRRF